MRTPTIRSIGFLNCADATINLTPVLEGNTQPSLVNVTRDEFERVEGDEGAMKQFAIFKLFGGHKTSRAKQVLQLMDNDESGHPSYMAYVESVAAQTGVTIKQLEIELDPFI